MIKKKFTPGPWRLGRVGSVVSDSPVEGMGGSDAIEYYGGHCVCESVVEPNARLIAAAPELYDALEHIVNELELYCDGSCEIGETGENCGPCRLCAMRYMAQTRLAQARGEA